MLCIRKEGDIVRIDVEVHETCAVDELQAKPAYIKRVLDGAFGIRMRKGKNDGSGT